MSIALSREKQLILYCLAISFIGLAASVFSARLLFIAFILFIGGAIFIKYPFGVLLALVIVRVGFDSIARQYYLFSGTALSVNILGLFNIGLVFLAVAYFAILRQRFPKYPFVISYLFFLYALLISFIPSGDKVLSIRGWTMVASYLAIYVLLVSQLNTQKRVNQLKAAIIFSMIIPVSVAAFQFFTGSGNTIISPGLNRVMGTLFHPSSLGMYLVIICPLLLTCIFTSEKKTTASVYIFLLGLIAICIGITFTRIAWVGLIIAWILTLFFFRRYKLLLMSILAGGIIFLFIAEPILSRITEAVFWENGRVVFSQYGSVAWRFKQWVIAQDLFRSSPLIGIGWGTFVHYGLANFVPHNDYLRLLAEAGLFGFFSFLIVMGNVIYWLLNKYRQFDKQDTSFYLVGSAIISVFIYLIFAITDNPIGLPEVSWYLWGILALAVGSVRVSRQTQILSTK